MNKTVYVGGDMLLKGSQLLREQEKLRLVELGFTPYAPQDDKEINDKQNQSEDDNNGLAEKIFHKDTMAMLDADILIFEVSNNNVGTTAEIGQWAMIKKLDKEIKKAPRLETSINNLTEQGSFHGVIQTLATKPIFFHSTDVRDTDIPEAGHRRSHSYNQYLIGCVMECNPNGIQTWEEIEQELLKIK